MVKLAKYLVIIMKQLQ